MHAARRGDGTCPALGIIEEKLPPPSHPDFLGTQDDIIFFCWQSRTSLGLQNNGIFILAELKKSYIYLHRSKNNEIYFFLISSFIYSSTQRNQTGTRGSGVRWDPRHHQSFEAPKKMHLKVFSSSSSSSSQQTQQQVTFCVGAAARHPFPKSGCQTWEITILGHL